MYNILGYKCSSKTIGISKSLSQTGYIFSWSKFVPPTPSAGRRLLKSEQPQRQCVL